MTKDIVESQRLKKIMGSKAKQCYGNAFRVVLTVPEYADAEYVEGLMVNSGLVFEHGWVEKDGVIVDPTLPEQPLIYFPGLRFRGQQGLVEALNLPKPAEHKPKDLPIFLRFGWVELTAQSSGRQR